MSPILIAAGMFLLLEGVHHYSATLSFGIAIGMAVTALLTLIAMREPTTKPKAHGGGDEHR